MEILLLIVFIIGGLVIAGIVKGLDRGAAIAQAVNVTGKIKHTIDWLTHNLDSEKLNGAEKRYAYYYIAYLDEIARAICLNDGINYHDGNRFLIYHEAQRLLGSGAFDDDPSLTKSKSLLSNILSKEAGQRGREDGRIDGTYVVEPTNPGPYYNLARAYFDLPPAERRGA